MNSIVTVGGKLALICVVAALCLGLVNAVTEPAILKVKAKQLADALMVVSLDGTIGDANAVSDQPYVNTYYSLAVEDYSGYILRLNAIGYGGDMDLLASYRSDGSVLAISLMDNQETPGLGKEAERSEYMAKYIGFGSTDAVPSAKHQLTQTQVDAISGATITFVAIGDALNAGADFVKSRGNDE